MYAVKAFEFDLLEHILELIQGEDVDLENIAGDTALTMACRGGRLEFVELLVENGADVNIETLGGRTPLMEATKSGHISIVDFLIKSGSQVMYRSKKHSKTAMAWARQMHNVELFRVLELGAIVQSQVNVLFQAIGAGDTEKVKAIIRDGEPFDARNSYLFRDEMEK